MAEIRNRIKELRQVKASDLKKNPKNWRTHPLAQREALEGILSQVGYADALIARETPEGLELIDGHLRAETTPDAEVPVLVLDINEKEADLMLATLDPLANMAGRDEMKLRDLLDTVESHSTGINELLDGLIGESSDFGNPDNWEEEWKGMPEFEQENVGPYHSIQIHFRGEEDIAGFKGLIGQDFTDKAKSIWFPALRADERNDNTASAYLDK